MAFRLSSATWRPLSVGCPQYLIRVVAPRGLVVRSRPLPAQLLIRKPRSGCMRGSPSEVDPSLSSLSACQALGALPQASVPGRRARRAEHLHARRVISGNQRTRAGCARTPRPPRVVWRSGGAPRSDGTRLMREAINCHQAQSSAINAPRSDGTRLMREAINGHQAQSSAINGHQAQSSAIKRNHPRCTRALR